MTDLRKPQQVSIDTKSILIGSFVFAIAFALVGILTRHYVWIGA